MDVASAKPLSAVIRPTPLPHLSGPRPPKLLLAEAHRPSGGKAPGSGRPADDAAAQRVREAHCETVREGVLENLTETRNRILGNLAVLDSIGDRPGAPRLGEIRFQLSRMLRTLNDAAYAAKATLGNAGCPEKHPEIRAALNVNTLLTATVNEIRGELQAGGPAVDIEIRLSFPPPLDQYAPPATLETEGDGYRFRIQINP